VRKTVIHESVADAEAIAAPPVRGLVPDPVSGFALSTFKDIPNIFAAY
jgi:hypothetical protein